MENRYKSTRRDSSIKTTHCETTRMSATLQNLRFENTTCQCSPAARVEFVLPCKFTMEVGSDFEFFAMTFFDIGTDKKSFTL